MKQIEVNVKSKGKVVTRIKVPQFESVNEAITKLGGGDEGNATVLSLINRMLKTDMSNKARRPTTGPSLGKILKGELPETREAINKVIIDYARTSGNTQLLEKLGAFGLARISERPPNRTPTKSKKTRLSVKFNNGKVMEDSKAAHTFALAIKEMGFSEVEALGITLDGFPLVSHQHQKSSKYAQRQIDGWYVGTHSSTKAKKEKLEEIARRLDVGIKVEIIPWNKPLHRTEL